MRTYSKKLPESIESSLDRLEATMREKRNIFANGMARSAFGNKYPGQGSDGFIDLTPDEVAIRRANAEARVTGGAA